MKHPSFSQHFEELSFYPTVNGIKTNSAPNQRGKLSYPLNDLCAQPFNVYLLNKASQIQYINPAGLESNHFMSFKDAINKTVLDFIKKDNALFTLSHDKKVLTQHSKLLIEQDLYFQNGAIDPYITLKMPWFNEKNDLIGILGCSALLSKQPIAEFITQITRLGLINQRDFYRKENSKIKTHITNREKDCLRYLVRGKTSKSIANMLGLSVRTIEFYIENLKSKFDVHSKEELIEKALEDFS